MQIKLQNTIYILNFYILISTIDATSLKHLNSIKFIYEQLNLMTQNQFDHSREIMISLLYKCSPKNTV